MELHRRHLTILLNALLETDTHTIRVRHPADELGELLRVHLDAESPQATVQFPMRLEEYTAAREKIELEHGKRPYEDLPDAHAIVAALTGSGLVDLANQQAVDSYLDDVCYPAAESGEPPLMVGIDANIFPWEFPELLGIDHRTGPRDDHGRAPTNGYALSNGVTEELHWQFSHHTVDALVEAFGEEFERLENQPGGSKREGKLGISVYQSLIANRTVDLVDSETGDTNIVDGYVQYHDDHYKRPLLLSNDHGFVEQATEADIPAQRLAFQETLPRRTTAGWATVVDALYYLTVLFGVLRLPKVTLYGVWEDKEDVHWQNGTLDLVFRGSQSAARQPVVRHRYIAEQYDDLR